MNTRRVFLFVWIVSLSIAIGAFAQKAPKITISAERIPTPGHIDVRGSGFTPKRNVSSHLRRPDGGEFPVIPILTDERGEFTHDIDTLLLQVGVHELWVVDEAAKTTSNRVKFEVTAY